MRRSPATNGPTSAAVAVTTRIRTKALLPVFRLVGEPAEETAEISDRGTEFLRRDDVQDLPVRGRAVRHGTAQEVLLPGKQLDAGGPPVDVHDVAEIEALAFFSNRG